MKFAEKCWYLYWNFLGTSPICPFVCGWSWMIGCWWDPTFPYSYQGSRASYQWFLPIPRIFWPIHSNRTIVCERLCIVRGLDGIRSLPHLPAGHTPKEQFSLLSISPELLPQSLLFPSPAIPTLTLPFRSPLHILVFPFPFYSSFPLIGPPTEHPIVTTSHSDYSSEYYGSLPFHLCLIDLNGKRQVSRWLTHVGSGG